MRIDPYRLEAMKRLHLPTIIGEYGIQLKVSGRESFLGLCPFHEDKSPSLSVGKRGDKWLWNCFGCRASGNVIKMKKEGLAFGDTYRALLPNVNGHVEETNPPPVAPPAPPAAFFSRVLEIYHNALCESRPAQEYLLGRKIGEAALIRRFKVGFADGRLRRMLPDDAGHEFARALRGLGLLTAAGGEFFHNCVTFPIFDGNGAAVGMYGRRVQGMGPAHLYLPGPHRGVWNAAAVKAHKELILTESVIDAMSLCAAGLENAVPIYGVNGLTDEHLRQFREHRTRRVFLCLDNDPAGERARAAVTEKLTPLGIEVMNFDLPKTFKDPNEALMKGFPARELMALAYCNSYLATAKSSPELFAVEGEASAPTAGAAESAPPPVPAVTPEASLPAIPPKAAEEEKDAVRFSFGPRQYRVTGLASKRTGTLRVRSIKVESGGAVHLDSFDLYSAKGRAGFVGCCRRIFEAQEGELHGELNRIVEALEKIQTAEVLDAPDGPPPMTAAEEAEALRALSTPDLLKSILADMEALGYVGEEANKAVGYLVGVSRKLDEPMSCVLMSQSSAGKSVLAETVEKLTPPEDVMLLSRLTQNSLYYMKRDALKHKLLILEERVGAEAADYSIRTLQSKRKLVQAVPVKNEKTGQIETKTFEVEGPIAYIETTTRPRIADDNATRCFELTLDESPEQTRRIHEAQRRAKTLNGLKEKVQREAIQRRHWNMQRLLKPARVVIPYADKLDFPTNWLRTRRDHMRFLTLIEVVCFLHQHQRPVEKTEDGSEYIAATVEDYRAAYDLAGQVMGESLTELKKPQRRLLESIQGMGPSGEGFTRREIRERVGISDTRLRVLLEDLVSLEYLRPTENGGQGRACRYRLTDLVEGDERRLPGLTTPEALAARVASPA